MHCMKRRISWASAVQVYEALQRGSVHEALICTAGYVLGDYGNTMKGVPPGELFALLQERFPSMPPHAKGILLSAYLKLCLMAPQDIQLKELVRFVLMSMASPIPGASQAWGLGLSTAALHVEYPIAFGNRPLGCQQLALQCCHHKFWMGEGDTTQEQS